MHTVSQLSLCWVVCAMQGPEATKAISRLELRAGPCTQQTKGSQFQADGWLSVAGF